MKRRKLDGRNDIGDAPRERTRNEKNFAAAAV
jgi:hypothetical protein